MPLRLFHCSCKLHCLDNEPLTIKTCNTIVNYTFPLHNASPTVLHNPLRLAFGQSPVTAPPPSLLTLPQPLSAPSVLLAPPRLRSPIQLPESALRTASTVRRSLYSLSHFTDPAPTEIHLCQAAIQALVCFPSPSPHFAARACATPL